MCAVIDTNILVSALIAAERDHHEHETDPRNYQRADIGTRQAMLPAIKTPPGYRNPSKRKRSSSTPKSPSIRCMAARLFRLKVAFLIVEAPRRAVFLFKSEREAARFADNWARRPWTSRP